MDIQVASNFERYLFHLAGRDAGRLRGWMSEFERSGTLRVEPERFAQVGRDFLSAAVGEDETLETIREVHAEHGYLLDPHSAVGYRAAQRAPDGEAIPTICMATAHPAKFGEAIRGAIGREPAPPPALAGLEERTARLRVLPAEASAVKACLLETLASPGEVPARPRAAAGERR
jgi:threonine synthase